MNKITVDPEFNAPIQLGFDYGSLDTETSLVVQKLTGEIKTLMKRTAQDIIDIGGKIMGVKEHLGHGNFGAWLEAEFGWTQQTAVRFMQVHDKFKFNNMLNLGIPPTVLYLLSSPSVPQSARDEVIEAAGNGERVTVEQAKRVIAANKIELAQPEVIERIKESSPALYEQVVAGDVSLTQARRTVSMAEVKEAPLMPSDKYGVIYADPPWKYGDGMTENYGGARFHYPSMSIEELSNLPIKELAEDNSILFMWVTSPLLDECFEVIHRWGFTYKTSFVWDKVKHNMGHYNSVRHELLLVCTRGSCLPETNKLHDSVISIERTEHSVKPAYFRELIEGMYPSARKIELFAREVTQGWTSWGNQV